jgi:hypothetical protein
MNNEMKSVINSLTFQKKKTSQGPDGGSVEFYQTFNKLQFLFPFLCNICFIKLSALNAKELKGRKFFQLFHRIYKYPTYATYDNKI